VLRLLDADRNDVLAHSIADVVLADDTNLGSAG